MEVAGADACRLREMSRTARQSGETGPQDRGDRYPRGANRLGAKIMIPLAGQGKPLPPNSGCLKFISAEGATDIGWFLCGDDRSIPKIRR